MAETNDEFDVGPTNEQGKLDDLHEALDEMIDLNKLIAAQAEALELSKSTYHQIRTRRIPDIMAELQTKKMEFRGREFEVVDFVNGSLPKDPEKRAVAISLLKKEDASGLLKTVVQVSFGKGEENKAQKLYSDLAEEGLPAKLDSDVHPQTLQAFVRRKIKDGEEIDYEALGIFVSPIVRIKEPKT